jgi:hypothetical protein
MLVSRHPWQDALDYAARQCSEPWATQYSVLLAKLQLALSHQLRLAQGGRSGGEQVAKFFLDSDFPRTSRAFLGMATGPDPTHHVVGESSPAVPWWDRRYRDWFGAVAFTSLMGLGGNCGEPGPKCTQFLEQLATSCERDDAGLGNLFAPGIALALAFSEVVEQPISSRWATAFHDATGMQNVIVSDEKVIPPLLPDPRAR